MKFIVSSSALLKQLQQISGVINANTVLPILEDFLFEIEKGKLTVVATDLETVMKVHLDIEAKDSGKVCIPAKILMDSLKNIPEQPLTFNIDKNFSVELTSDNGKYKVMGENPDNFPKEPVADDANKWGEADKLFKEKNYVQSIESFFDYLRDEAADNVQLKREGNDFSFEICQGSKIMRGRGNGEELVAEINLARMPQPSVPVMRRLLEQNFVLYYSRYALDGDRLCMRFYTDIQTANPNKLYYALKELATKADKQDDLLVQDFSSLEALDTDHIIPIATEEKEIKYQFLQKWIKETLEYIQTLDQEKFSGGISYLLLSLVYRIDYLISPESSLQAIVEKVHYTYFAKDEKPATEKNGIIMDALKSIQAMPKEELFKFLFKSKSTFAIVVPQTQTIIGESISAANGNMAWYRDNNYHFIGKQICEYGISYAQYCYSLPSSLSQLFQLFMMVNYPDYFAALGFSETYAAISPDNTTVFKPHVNEIVERINTILSPWKTKYPKLEINAAQLKFDSIIHFNQSFTAAMETLNYDSI